MVDEGRIEFTLCLLLIVPFCSEASTITFSFLVNSGDFTWEGARDYCSSIENNMVTLDLFGETSLSWALKVNVSKVWVGLRRNSLNDSVWNWMDQNEDVSQTIEWAEGELSNHCAFVRSQEWISSKCNAKKQFFCSLGNGTERQTSPLSWHDAQNYCQTMNRSLVTVTEKNAASLTQDGWIGLYRVGGETWRWVGKDSSDYQNWFNGEPATADCGYLNILTLKYHIVGCHQTFPAACYDDSLVVVKQNKTWEEAVEHCNNLRTTCDSCSFKFLTLETDVDYAHVRKRIRGATTDEAWIGLRFVGSKWFWVDGRSVHDEGNLPQCPSEWKHCGVISQTNPSKWLIRDCSERRSFVCHKTDADSTGR